MKNQWIKTSTVLFLAMAMLTGINAQGTQAKAMGPNGQGERPCYGQGERPCYGQGERPDYCLAGRPAYGNRQAYGQPHGFTVLKLTEEQKEALSSLRLEHYKEMKPLRAQMGELKARENTLMSQELIDVKSINKLIDEKTSLMNKMQKMKLNHKLASREILSDEQQMILDQMRTMARRGDGPEGGPPKGAGMHHGGPQRGSQL